MWVDQDTRVAKPLRLPMVVNGNTDKENNNGKVFIEQ
jgi:hypothetical protein